MRPILIFLCLGAIGLFGCRTEDRSEEHSPGEDLVRSRCATCHRRPDPQDKTAPEWSDWMDEHREKAGLTDAELEQILDHLTGAAEN